jgi:hypothetical protein
MEGLFVFAKASYLLEVRCAEETSPLKREEEHREMEEEDEIKVRQVQWSNREPEFSSRSSEAQILSSSARLEAVPDIYFTPVGTEVTLSSSRSSIGAPPFDR